MAALERDVALRVARIRTQAASLVALCHARVREAQGRTSSGQPSAAALAHALLQRVPSLASRPAVHVLLAARHIVSAASSDPPGTSVVDSQARGVVAAVLDTLLANSTHPDASELVAALASAPDDSMAAFLHASVAHAVMFEAMQSRSRQLCLAQGLRAWIQAYNAVISDLAYRPLQQRCRQRRLRAVGSGVVLAQRLTISQRAPLPAEPPPSLAALPRAGIPADVSFAASPLNESISGGSVVQHQSPRRTQTHHIPPAISPIRQRAVPRHLTLPGSPLDVSVSSPFFDVSSSSAATTPAVSPAARLNLPSSVDSSSDHSGGSSAGVDVVDRDPSVHISAVNRDPSVHISAVDRDPSVHISAVDCDPSVDKSSSVDAVNRDLSADVSDVDQNPSGVAGRDIGVEHSTASDDTPRGIDTGRGVGSSHAEDVNATIRTTAAANATLSSAMRALTAAACQRVATDLPDAHEDALAYRARVSALPEVKRLLGILHDTVEPSSDRPGDSVPIEYPLSVAGVRVAHVRLCVWADPALVYRQSLAQSMLSAAMPSRSPLPPPPRLLAAWHCWRRWHMARVMRRAAVCATVHSRRRALCRWALRVWLRGLHVRRARALAIAWRAWRLPLMTRALQRRLATQRTALYLVHWRAVFVHRQQHRLRLAWAAWRAYVGHAARLRALLPLAEHAVQRVRQRTALHAWSRALHSQRARLRACRAVTAAHRAAVLTSAFAAWTNVAAARASARSRLAARQRRRITALHFHRWRSACVAARVRRHRLRRALFLLRTACERQRRVRRARIAWRSILLRRSVARWRLAFCLARGERALSQLAATHWLASAAAMRCTAVAFRRWRTAVQRDRLARHWRRRVLLVATLATWRRNAVTHAMVRSWNRRRSISGVLAAWRAAALTQRLNRDSAAAMADRHWQRRLLRRWFVRTRAARTANAALADTAYDRMLLRRGMRALHAAMQHDVARWKARHWLEGRQRHMLRQVLRHWHCLAAVRQDQLRWTEAMIEAVTRSVS